MDVYFLDLKYGQTLNSSYFLETGTGSLDFDKSSYSVGDEVSLFIKIPEWQYLAIQENCIDTRVDTRGSIGEDNYIFIEFIIKRKRHTLVHSHDKRGHLQPHSPSLYLEPVSWGHEDLFKWVCMGELPSWMPEEEIENYKNGR